MVVKSWMVHAIFEATKAALATFEERDAHAPQVLVGFAAGEDVDGMARLVVAVDEDFGLHSVTVHSEVERAVKAALRGTNFYELDGLANELIAYRFGADFELEVRIARATIRNISVG